MEEKKKSATQKRRGRPTLLQEDESSFKKDFDELYTKLEAESSVKSKIPLKPASDSQNEEYKSFFQKIKKKRNSKMKDLANDFLAIYEERIGLSSKRRQLSKTKEDNSQVQSEDQELADEKSSQVTVDSDRKKEKKQNGRLKKQVNKLEKDLIKFESKQKNSKKYSILFGHQISEEDDEGEDDDFDEEEDFSDFDINSKMSIYSKFLNNQISNDAESHKKDNNSNNSNKFQESQAQKESSQILLFEEKNKVDQTFLQSSSGFNLPEQSSSSAAASSTAASAAKQSAISRQLKMKSKYEFIQSLLDRDQIIPQLLQQPQQQLLGEQQTNQKEIKKTKEEEMQENLEFLKQFYDEREDCILYQLFKDSTKYKDMLEKVVSKTDEASSCSICLLLPLVPLKCMSCKMAICAQCTIECRKSKNLCPICCTEPFKLQKLSTQELNAAVLKQHFYCEYKEFGCSKTSSIEEVLFHEINCQFKVENCGFCYQKVLCKDLEDHKDNCPQRTVICNSCSFPYKFCEKKSHNCINQMVNHYKALQKEFKQYMLDTEDKLEQQERTINQLLEKQRRSYGVEPSYLNGRQKVSSQQRKYCRFQNQTSYPFGGSQHKFSNTQSQPPQSQNILNFMNPIPLPPPSELSMFSNSSNSYGSNGNLKKNDESSNQNNGNKNVNNNFTNSSGFPKMEGSSSSDDYKRKNPFINNMNQNFIIQQEQQMRQLLPLQKTLKSFNNNNSNNNNSTNSTNKDGSAFPESNNSQNFSNKTNFYGIPGSKQNTSNDFQSQNSFLNQSQINYQLPHFPISLPYQQQLQQPQVQPSYQPPLLFSINPPPVPSFLQYESLLDMNLSQNVSDSQALNVSQQIQNDPLFQGDDLDSYF